ncbi:ankyrin repeat-containing domain protein [Paraphoma chrysanthemicola]|nr:ankyrin repeat-containing domain protein [Paraphoma chrysanthemicola]
MSLSTSLHDAIVGNDMESLRAELTSHPNIGRKQLDACLALAMPSSHMDVIKVLLHVGARLNYRAFCAMIAREDPNVFQLLVDFGWDIDSTQFESTALHHALYHEASLRWLLDHGADPNTKEQKLSKGVPKNGTSPIAEAAALADPSPLRLLLAHGAKIDPNAVFYAIGMRRSTNGTANLELLIEHGADLNTVSTRWYTPLFRAVNVNSEAKLRLLLEHGADPNYVAQTPTGNFTAADLAEKHSNVQLAKILRDACSQVED